MAFARILLTVGALATVLQRAIAQGRFGEDVILGEDFKMYGADVRKADINGDGQLDRAETFILVKTAHARRFAKIEAAAHLDAFKRIDDGDGAASLEEAYRFLLHEARTFPQPDDEPQVDASPLKQLLRLVKSNPSHDRAFKSAEKTLVTEVFRMCSPSEVFYGNALDYLDADKIVQCIVRARHQHQLHDQTDSYFSQTDLNHDGQLSDWEMRTVLLAEYPKLLRRAFYNHDTIFSSHTEAGTLPAERMIAKDAQRAAQARRVEVDSMVRAHATKFKTGMGSKPGDEEVALRSQKIMDAAAVWAENMPEPPVAPARHGGDEAHIHYIVPDSEPQPRAVPGTDRLLRDRGVDALLGLNDRSRATQQQQKQQQQRQQRVEL